MKNQINELEIYNSGDEKLLVSYMKEKELKERYQAILSDKYGINRKENEVSLKSIAIWKYAAILVTLVASLIVFDNFNNESAASLALKYVAETNTLGNQDLMRKDLTAEEDVRISANLAFVNQKFKESISHYEKLISKNKGQSSDYFYLGVSYLKADNPDLPKSIQNLHLAEHDSHFSNEINWYLALAYTANLQDEKALEQLNILLSKSNYKQTEVLKLKKLLSKN